MTRATGVALACLLAASTLPAPAADPAPDRAVRARKAAALNFNALCAELGKTQRATTAGPAAEAWRIAVAQEAIKNYGFADRDVGYIRERRVRLGMAECSVLAALGVPDKLNRTTNAAGRYDQWVYRKRGVYVYTQDGTVTSWQE